MSFGKLGLALAGGGGKGAYQIGVWKALRELGFDKEIQKISGSSVGGLNGALIAQNRYELAEKIWTTVETRNMLTLNDWPEIMSSINKVVPNTTNLHSLLQHTINTKGLLKQDGLKSMIAEGLDGNTLDESALPLTVTAHNKSYNRVDYLEVNGSPDAHKMLLATSALPFIFEDINIAGEIYSDGGFYWGLPNKNIDNSPVKPLVESGCDTILLIYLSADDLLHEHVKYPGKRIIPILPSQSLGGALSTLDFSNDGAKRRIQQGYVDGLHILNHIYEIIKNNEKYSEIWERAIVKSEEEKRLNCLLYNADNERINVVDKIAETDRIILEDDFSNDVEFSASIINDDEVPMLEGIKLKSQALLDDIKRRDIEGKVDSFVIQNIDNTARLEAAAIDAVASLSPIAGRANELYNQTAIERLWGSITGSNQMLSATNQASLAEAQFAALRLISNIQGQQCLTFEFAQTLQNRANALQRELVLVKDNHNQDLGRVYRSIANAYSKVRGKLVEHNERLNNLERRVEVLNWLAHPNQTSAEGHSYKELSPTIRLVCLVNKFYQLTAGVWTVGELESLKQMFANTKRDDSEDIICLTEFIEKTQSQHEIRSYLFQNLHLVLDGEEHTSEAKWLQSIHQGSAHSKDHEAVLASWGYSNNTELPASEFALELLYMMKLSGLTVTQFTELSKCKNEWKNTLSELRKFTINGVLSKALSSDIDSVELEINRYHTRIPLIGRFSVGKSSLLNTWLGRTVQVVDSDPCTSVPTEFHYAHGKSEHFIAWYLKTPDSTELKEIAYPIEKYQEFLSKITINDGLQYVELHLNSLALARHADLILVDMPGTGSTRIDHDATVNRYINAATSFIICASKANLIDEDERLLIDKIATLTSSPSLIVCKEDERDNDTIELLAIREQTANATGVQYPQRVRGCAAHKGDIIGFEQLINLHEQEKETLFINKVTPLVQKLLVIAKTDFEKRLNSDFTEESLRQEMQQLTDSKKALSDTYCREKDRLLRDCEGHLIDSIINSVEGVIRPRREYYAKLINSNQDISQLLQADITGAVTRSIEHTLIPRISDVATKLETTISTSAIRASLNFTIEGAQIEQDNKLAGVLGGVAGFVAGRLLAVAGGPIGLVIGAVLGMFFSSKNRVDKSQKMAVESINSVLTQLNAALPTEMKKIVTDTLDDLYCRLTEKLERMVEDVKRLENQLSDTLEEKARVRVEIEVALQKVKSLLGSKVANNISEECEAV